MSFQKLLQILGTRWMSSASASFSDNTFSPWQHADVSVFLAGKSQALAWPGQVTYDAALPLPSVQLCHSPNEKEKSWPQTSHLLAPPPWVDPSSPWAAQKDQLLGAEPLHFFECVVLLQRVPWEVVAHPFLMDSLQHAYIFWIVFMKPVCWILHTFRCVFLKLPWWRAEHSIPTNTFTQHLLY